ncbi:hypothetical protein FOZ60_013910 [Perkinsus olseni]|nr:hypothetical protein FOZ60_013910 [Perkinsus olseni]
MVFFTTFVIAAFACVFSPNCDGIIITDDRRLRSTSALKQLTGNEAVASLQARIKANCPKAGTSADLLALGYNTPLADCLFNEISNAPELDDLPLLPFHHKSADFEIDFTVSVHGELGITLSCGESKTVSVHGLSLADPINLHLQDVEYAVDPPSNDSLNSFKENVHNVCGKALLPGDLNSLYVVSPSKIFTEVEGESPVRRRLLTHAEGVCVKLVQGKAMTTCLAHKPTIYK